MGRKRTQIRRLGCLVTAVPCSVITVFLLAIGPFPPPPTLIAGPRNFIDGFQKGITYEAWWHGEYSSANSDKTLAQVIKPSGANWIAVIVKCTQLTLTSTNILCNTNASTASDEDIRHVIEYAHQLGLRVMLKPHIDLADPRIGRSDINFGQDQGAWQTWFDNYTRFITHYATLAQQLTADYFVVGTELSGTVDQTEHWRNVIKSVQQIYKGPLTYAALGYRDDYRVSWWDALDAIGINAYYPLTLSTKPTLAQLKLGWMPSVFLLDALSKHWNRPIIFTEIGYLSVEGTNRSPSYWALDGATSLQEQADCYQAVFEVFQDKPWWQGVFWWSWSTDPNQGGTTDRGYTGHGKPAENILKMYYAVPSSAVSIP